MQFGVAVPAASASAAAAMGYDFVELRVSELSPEDTGDAWRAARQAIEAAGIPAMTYNFFLPPDLRVVGPSVDHDRLSRYVDRAAERAAAIGGRTFVFGSGGARRVPDGFAPDEAMGQYRDAVRIAAHAAGRHGMGIALEALNRTEANLLNTVEDAISQADQVGLPNVGVVADSYHMQMVGEPFSHVLDAGHRLHHVQVCDTGRMPPGAGVSDLAGFFIYLNALGYEGSVAVESAFRDFTDEGPRALASIRELGRLRGDLSFVH